MLPGRFVKVITEYNSTQELLDEVGEGYLKGSWREGNALKTGYLVVSSGKLVGAIVEDVLTGEKIEGERALREMVRIAKEKKVHLVEVYEADVEELMREYPGMRVTSEGLEETIPGWDLDSLMKLLTSHQGEVHVHHDRTSWALYVDRGRIKAARTIRGPLLKGDKALTGLLMDMGHIVKGGKIVVAGRGDFRADERVTKEKSLIEGVELLKEKMEFEGRGS